MPKGSKCSKDNNCSRGIKCRKGGDSDKDSRLLKTDSKECLRPLNQVNQGPAVLMVART